MVVMRYYHMVSFNPKPQSLIRDIKTSSGLIFAPVLVSKLSELYPDRFDEMRQDLSSGSASDYWKHRALVKQLQGTGSVIVGKGLLPVIQSGNDIFLISDMAPSFYVDLSALCKVEPDLHSCALGSEYLRILYSDRLLVLDVCLIKPEEYVHFGNILSLHKANAKSDDIWPDDCLPVDYRALRAKLEVSLVESSKDLDAQRIVSGFKLAIAFNGEHGSRYYFLSDGHDSYKLHVGTDMEAPPGSAVLRCGKERCVLEKC